MVLNRIKNKIYRSIKKILTQIGFGVKCNICHNKTLRFGSDAWHEFVICQNCGSQIRHRLLMAAFQHTDDFNYKKIIENRTILHFAPDLCLRNFFEVKSKKYLTADFMAEGYSYDSISLNIDISMMSVLQDNSIDVLLALDVLEHVPNHLEALTESFRVLKSGGICIFTIPQKDGLDKTFQDNTFVSPEERIKHYGQWDHLRIYGNDFKEFMKNVGFNVTVIDENFFSQNLVNKHVLFPPILSSNPLATNYRKVYFGIKN